MNERISNIFDYDDEIVVVKEQDDLIDPARIKELTMKRIHDEGTSPVEMKRVVKKTRPAWRIILIAAVVAILLIGTALAVYQYTLKDAVIEDVPTRDSELYEWKAGETETRLSLNGFADSPEYQAYVEWTDWNREWNAAHPDPWQELGEDDSYYETPGNYLTYDAWFTEQGDTLDAIAEKYGLTLLGEHIGFRTESQLCRAIGAENIVADGYDIYGDYLFPNGTFKAVGDTVIGGRAVDFTIWNSVKGSFVPLSDIIPEDYTEWSYTTKDSFEVILMTDNLRAWTDIIAPLSGSFVTATLRTDDAQAVQDFADAIDLRALDALFATDSARAAAVQAAADYIAYRQTATMVGEIGEDEAAVLAYLGDWYPTDLPEGVPLDSMHASAPDHFEDFYFVNRFYDGMGGRVEFFYRELEPLDGTNEETRLRLGTYMDDPFSDEPRTLCMVNGYEAVMTEPNGAGAGNYQLVWLDTDRQLLFRIGMYNTTYDAVMAAAESVTGTAPETPPVRTASTPEERLRYSLMPLGDMQMYGGNTVQRSVHAKQVLETLGNYGLTALPEGAGDPIMDGQRNYMYEYYWDGRADWGEVWKSYRSDPELGLDGLTLRYKRFDDGRTAEAYEIEKQYDGHYADVTDCTVGGQHGYIASGDFYEGQTILEWYDGNRDLIFTLSISTDVYDDMTDAELIEIAESVKEQPWTGAERGHYTAPYTELEGVLADLGAYALPGVEYGSVVSFASEQTEDWKEAPFWFVEDSPYASESISTSYADGLALGWQRTWADTTHTAENSAESFAAITKYLLACDEDGAVQTGLSVNGFDAICVSYPYSEIYEESVTQLMWYDEDAGLIFSIADFPGADGTPRTAAQLVTLAESVTAQ